MTSLSHSFSRAYREAIYQGFSDGVKTNLILSGVWTSSFHFGNFMGPTISGFVNQRFGFRQDKENYIVVVFCIHMLRVIITQEHSPHLCGRLPLHVCLQCCGARNQVFQAQEKL